MTPRARTVSLPAARAGRFSTQPGLRRFPRPASFVSPVEPLATP
jgi:hypothetical protein